jgi:tetratricopeptide (TPR) repeat protein
MDRAPQPAFARFGPWIGALIPVVLGGAVFAPMLGAAYVWDDLIYQQWQLPFFRGIHEAFFPPLGRLQGFAGFYYRPLIPLSSFLDQALSGHPGGGIPAAWSHGMNVVYHLAVTALVYLLAFTILRETPRRAVAAAGAGVLFALHPIHAEVVCSVSGRTDLLATLFVIASFLAAFAARGRAGVWIGAAFSAVLFFLGLLSKETAVALLVLIPAGFWLFPSREKTLPRGKRIAAWALLAALLLVALVVYLKLRVAAGFNYGNPSALGSAETVRVLVTALGYYVRKLLVPWPQLHFVVRLPAAAPAVLSVAAASLVALLVSRVSRPSRPILAFSLLWFVACLAPALLVVLRPLSVTPVAERYLYLPSVALCLGVGWWIATADFRRFAQRAAAVLFVTLLLAYAASSVERTRVWQDNRRFWADVLLDSAAEQTPIVQANYAAALQSLGRNDEARLHYRKAYELFTGPWDRRKVLVNLAAIDQAEAARSLTLGHLSQAEAQADAAILSLESLVESELKFDPQPNATLGAALAVKAQTQVRRTGTTDPALLTRAVRHLDVALNSMSQDRGLLEYRALCQRLLAATRR